MREESLVKIQQNSSKIVSLLEEINEFIREMRENIKEEKSKSENAAIFKTISAFVDNLEDVYGKMIGDIKISLETAVFIGVIGKYSHGKSSLVNAILKRPAMNARDADILPTGDNIITATPSAVVFQEGNDVSFRVDDEERPISLGEFKKVAVSSSNIDSVFIDYGVGSDSLLGDFLTNNIRIVDTPGLGGPFFNDALSLARWTERFGMVLVIIKATDITAETANAVKPFLAEFHKPILIIVTYWDAWNRGETVYSECASADEAKDMARSLINRHFGKLPGFSVDELANNVTFVSAKKYLENGSDLDPLDVSKDYMDFSKSWNINELKKTISNFVRDKTDILTSERTMSTLIKDKLILVSNNFDNAEKTIGKLETDLAKTFEKSDTITKDNNIDDLVEEFKGNIKSEWDEAIRRFAKELKGLAAEVKNSAVREPESVEQFNIDCVNSFDENINGKLSRKRKALYSKLKIRLERTLTKDMKMSSMAVRDLLRDYDFGETLEGEDFIDPLKLPAFSILSNINPFSKKKPKDLIREAITKWECKNTSPSAINSKLEEYIDQEEDNIYQHFSKLRDIVDETKTSLSDVNDDTNKTFKKIKNKIADIKELID